MGPIFINKLKSFANEQYTTGREIAEAIKPRPVSLISVNHVKGTKFNNVHGKVFKHLYVKRKVAMDAKGSKSISCVFSIHTLGINLI